MHLLDSFPVFSMLSFRSLFTLLSSAFFFLSLSTASPYPRKPPVLDFGYAKYHGLRNSSVEIYHGIRYAAPPTGSLRWQPPVPIESQNNYSSSRVINATMRGPQCQQGDQSHSSSPAQNLLAAQFPLVTEILLPSSEDCLVMDIFLPMRPKTEKPPVVVNFHGGGRSKPSTRLIGARF